VRFRHAPLHPNLYVFLVGPPGIGKDHAIGFAQSLVTPEAAAYINPFPGSLTIAHLSDLLVAQQIRPLWPEGIRPAGDKGASLWLIHSELVADIRGGPLAEELVRSLVKLYSGTTSDVVVNATRMHGERRLHHAPCINWIAGSTFDWFPKAIPPDLFASGLSRRCFYIVEERNYDDRRTEPIYPADYNEVVAHLQDRIGVLVCTRGEFVLSADASAAEAHWVKARPGPSSDVEASVWDGQHVLMLKLAMLYSLAEASDPLVIRHRHLVAAQQMMHVAAAGTNRIAEIVYAAAGGLVVQQVEKVEALIREYGQMQHSVLLRMVTKRGISAAGLREIANTLVDSRVIHRVIGDRGATYYRWGPK
jgi:hypothetical protein